MQDPTCNPGNLWTCYSSKHICLKFTLYQSVISQIKCFLTYEDSTCIFFILYYHLLQWTLIWALGLWKTPGDGLYCMRCYRNPSIIHTRLVLYRVTGRCYRNKVELSYQLCHCWTTVDDILMITQEMTWNHQVFGLKAFQCCWELWRREMGL